jgi:hypothetical protein
MRCALTRPTPTLDRMAANTGPTGVSELIVYEIRVHGPIGPTIMQAFPSLTASRSGQVTLLTGSIPDQAALYGVIHQLEALGLRLEEIRQLPTADPRATGPNT